MACKNCKCGKDKSIPQVRDEIKKDGKSWLWKPVNLEKYSKKFRVEPEVNDGIENRVIGYYAYEK